jgi:hypothetical protein
MKQGEARRRAKELGGIAIHAYPRANGGFRIGGWPNNKGMTWVVVDLNRRNVLDGTRTEGDELP